MTFQEQIMVTKKRVCSGGGGQLKPKLAEGGDENVRAQGGLDILRGRAAMWKSCPCTKRSGNRQKQSSGVEASCVPKEQKRKLASS